MKKTRTKKLIENSTYTSTNRNYKDGVFTTLFNDEEKICELYNALKDTDEYKASDIQIRTLENALYKLYKDDLAFSVAGRFVILTEHQSTPSANMPIRMLIYIARVYERLLDKKLIYGSSLFKIPRPELYVFYNGLEEWGDNLTMKLSDAYSGYGEKTSRVGVSEDGVSEDGALKCGVTGCDDIDEFLEVKVKVININPKKHAAILERSRTLNEYGMFVDTIREYLDKGYTRDDAIKAAIKYCIERGILEEFLENHGSEVYNMIFQEFNMDTALEVAESEGLAKGESIGLIKGRAEGIHAKALETAKNMKKEGFPKDVIARIVGLDAEAVEKM